jgi:hypothetical protein
MWAAQNAGDMAIDVIAASAAELEALGRQRPVAVMVLANNVADPTPDGSCTIVEEYYHLSGATLAEANLRGADRSGGGAGAEG